jgi:transposase
MLASSQEFRAVKTGMDDPSGTSIIPTRPRKHYRSLEERRQIVEEALVPGVSVSAVARARGVNANLLFHWRKLYRAGLLSRPEQGEVRLLPVRVERENKRKRRRHAEPAAAEEDGTLEVTLAKGQVRIVGKVNSEVLRVVLRCLLG